MDFIIEGKVATLRKNDKFDYIVENREVTDADSFSLNITFPLKNCNDNIDIFGWLFRPEVDLTEILLNCEIRDVAFNQVGVLLITKLTEREVSCQFLGGRSAQNYIDPFDKYYINTLDLGTADTTLPANMATVWKPYPEREYVALPWISSGSGTLFNDTTYYDGIYKPYNCQSLSIQPYLLPIVKKVFDAIGYSYDLSEWDNSDAKYLLICNSLPPATRSSNKLAKVLPHWTIADFIKEIERLLDCEFDINHASKHISFAFREILFKNKENVRLERIVDSFSAEQSLDDIDTYSGNICYKYKERGDKGWLEHDCQWYVDYMRENNEVVEHDSFDELVDFAKKSFASTETAPAYEIFQYARYAKDVDRYFIPKLRYTERVKGDTYTTQLFHYSLTPVNTFGNINITKEKEDSIPVEELQILPVRIESTLIVDSDGHKTSDHGCYMYLPFEESDEEDWWGTVGDSTPQPFAYQNLLRGEREDEVSHYDTLFVGFWDGTILDSHPYPYLDKITIGETWKVHKKGFPNLDPKKRSIYQPKVDTKRKYIFTFLSDNIPNPRSVFYVFGKKYVCARITMEVSINGVSKKKKGEFYRILEE